MNWGCFCIAYSEKYCQNDNQNGETGSGNN